MEETPLPSTLYPKITNHIKEVVKVLRWKLRDTSDPEAEVPLEPIPIVGTVKLHGTHADILIHSDNAIVFQSRNKAKLLVTEDNQGFATSMSRRTASLLQLRDQYIARWKELNPGIQHDESIPTTIAGEWIGSSIQKGVAISQLSKRFVIISVKMNGSWVLDSSYSDIECPSDDIYNISRGGVYTSTLYPDDIQRTIADLEPLAEQIAARCPFAESFGISGEGEGIVWKLASYFSEPELWFKTKGGKFKPTFTPPPKKPTEGTAEKRKLAETLAKAWCGELRLEQGWDYLREQGIEQNMRGLGPFLKWVQNDVVVEEKGCIEENGVYEQMLRMEIMKVAKPWYMGKYESGDE